ncbi:hypothetical protein ACEPAG_1460 [Sanghuangporus baumii]
MSRQVPGSSQDTFRDNPTEPPRPSRRSRVTELPEELHDKIILPPSEWEQRSGDPLSSRTYRPFSQDTPTQQQQLPSISARLPGLRGGSDRNRGPLPSLREATAFVPEIRSLNPPRGVRESGSPSYTLGRVLGRDEPASRQDLPYTSLPRYSADVSNGADEARYARELPLPEYEGRYEANPATAAPLPQRSFTFPATSEERTYSHHAPDLLSMSGVMHAEEPFARASSEQSTVARSIARKGKGKAKEAGAGDTQEGSADKEEDELQETSDEDGKPQFSFASSGPSRTGSAGGTRAPRTKIEVACNFCRQRKMKCDGLRPTCKNCARKGNECTYIEEVRRRGPGKKKKAIDARPKKSNKRIEAQRQAKGKGKDKAAGSTDVSTQETEAGSWQSEASGSGLQVEGAGMQQFTSAIGQGGPSGGLYLPSPLQQMQSSPVVEGSTSTLPGGPNISPFPSGSLSLPLYPPEQFPPPYGQSPPFAGGNVFLPGQSPEMHTRDIVDPYAGVGVNISESGGSSIMMSEVSLPGTSRTASMSSSGSSSSDGELGRQSRRRRTSKRARTVTRRARELEEGEIDEGGPSGSGGPRR